MTQTARKTVRVIFELVGGITLVRRRTPKSPNSHGLCAIEFTHAEAKMILSFCQEKDHATCSDPATIDITQKTKYRIQKSGTTVVLDIYGLIKLQRILNTFIRSQTVAA